MQIRLADLNDLNGCLTLDSSYETTHVWQMHSHTSAQRVDVSFSFVRLPRTLTIHQQPDESWLRADWERQECFLVAEHEGALLGYLDMVIQRRQSAGWINNVVVGRDYRRHGIGKALLNAARLWAQQAELRVLLAEINSRNYPALQLFQKLGYRFCGFNDQHFHSEDIAIFMAHRLK
jgi:GNAT superfamily N-acetyltransferase